METSMLKKKRLVWEIRFFKCFCFVTGDLMICRPMQIIAGSHLIYVSSPVQILAHSTQVTFEISKHSLNSVHCLTPNM